MRGVQALGLLLPASGRVQVSLNVIDVDAAPLVDVVERVRELAARRGVEVGPSELVGLLPESAVAPAGRARARGVARRQGARAPALSRASLDRHAARRR